MKKKLIIVTVTSCKRIVYFVTRTTGTKLLSLALWLLKSPVSLFKIIISWREKKYVREKGAVVPFAYYKYQKIYLPGRGVWISRPVETRFVRLPDQPHYYFILPFRNPKNFCIRFQGKDIVYFGNTLEVHRFIATVYFSFNTHWCDQTYLRMSYLERFFNFPHDLGEIPYFAPLKELLLNMFREVVYNESVLWDSPDYLEISKFRKRIFEVKFESEEDLDKLIVYLDFLKWELKIDSIFSKPNQMYQYFLPLHLTNPDYKIPFLEFQGNRKISNENPGQGLNGPLLNQMALLLNALIKKKKINLRLNKKCLIKKRVPSLLFAIKTVNAAWDKFKLKAWLVKLHINTFKKCVKANFPAALKVMGKRAILIFLLAKCNKFIIYPIYVLIALLKKSPGDWRIKYGDFKIACFDIKLWIKNFDLSIYEDKLKVIFFNVLISIPLRILFGSFGGPKIPTLDEYQRELTERFYRSVAKWFDKVDNTLSMRSVAQKVHKSSSSLVLGSRLFTYTLSKVLSLHSATRNLIPRSFDRGFPTQNTLATSNSNFLLREHWQNPGIAMRGYALLDETQAAATGNPVQEDKLITFRGEHNILGLIPLAAIPIAKNAITNSYEPSSISEFLAGAFIVKEKLYVRHNGQLFRFVGLSPHQPGRLFANLTDEERSLAKFKKGEPKNDLSAHFQNCQNPDEQILVSVEVKFPRAPRDLVRHMANNTVAGQQARIMTLADLSNIPPHPEQRWGPEIVQEKVEKERADLGLEVVGEEEIFFRNEKDQPICGFDVRYFDPVIANADWSRDQVYESAVQKLHKENSQDLSKLADDLKETKFDPLTNKGLVPVYQELIDNTQRAVHELIEKTQ